MWENIGVWLDDTAHSPKRNARFDFSSLVFFFSSISAPFDFMGWPFFADSVPALARLPELVEGENKLHHV